MEETSVDKNVASIVAVAVIFPPVAAIVPDFAAIVPAVAVVIIVNF